MTHSMTAFARAQSQVGSTAICWELKSVNHRYLEANYRIPESFRALEIHLRQALRDQVSRGKFECMLKVDFVAGSEQSLHINEGLINAILIAGDKLAENKQLANDLTVSKLLSWPEVAEMRQPNADEIGKEVVQLFQDALKKLINAREAEGKKLRAFIEIRLQLLIEQVNAARTEASMIGQQTRDKLLGRLEGLQLNVTEGRIEQEIALMLARLDISEEMDRLHSHIDEVSRILDSKEPIGRRLDFLMQELNREANTLSSKSDSAVLTKHAVEMKVLIEQMREQIQNLE